MINDIFFSIIIPVFNKQKYIEKTLISVFNQSFKNYEVIIIDDGSTDESLNVIKRNIRNRSNVRIISKKNHGKSIARNIGLVNSKGIWAAFLDADDIWEKNHLLILNLMAANNPEAILISNRNFTNNINNPVNKKIEFKYINYLKESTINHGLIQTSAAAIKLSSLNQIGFMKNYVTGEDTEYWLRIYLLGNKIAISNQYTVFYNTKTGGAMDQEQIKILNETNTIIDIKKLTASVDTLERLFDYKNVSLNIDIKDKNSYINSLIIIRLKFYLINFKIYDFYNLSSFLKFKFNFRIIIFFLIRKLLKIFYGNKNDMSIL